MDVRGSGAALDLDDDIAGHWIGDAEGRHEVSRRSRNPSSVAIICGRAATMLGMPSHSPTRQNVRSPVLMSTPRRKPPNPARRAIRIDELLLAPRLDPKRTH
jgi:hypothetical protein